jgi:hypothetical protein
MTSRVSIITVVSITLTLIACAKRPVPQPPTLEVRLDNLNVAEHEHKRSEMRIFLWEHWRSRQPAVLLLTSISKEGKRADTRFEIKNTPPGPLLLQVTVTGYRYGYNGQAFANEKIAYDIYTVERVLPDNCFLLRTDSIVEVLPENSNHPAGDYCLRLMGWGDRVESYF